MRPRFGLPLGMLIVAILASADRRSRRVWSERGVEILAPPGAVTVLLGNLSKA